MITKTSYEEFYRYCDFGGWLAENESIVSASAIVEDANKNVKPDMSSNVSIENKKVKYMLKGGVAGEIYTLRIRVNTSNNQKFEAVFGVKVL